jgi:predicted permease
MLASIRAFVWRVIHLARRSGSESSFERELEFHLQMEIDENLRQGMSYEEARRQALLALGGLEQTREACRQACGIRWATELWQDLRYGSRMMLNNPSFNTVAILTLALGIGANTAIFTMVNALLLRPLPYRDPHRLVWVAENESLPKSELVPGPHFFEWRARSKSLEQIAAFGGGPLTLTGAGDPERLDCGTATAPFFATLGIQPLRGRFFTADEDHPGRNKVAVISYGLWQRRFYSDANIVGRTIVLENESYQVIGVLPRDFRFFTPFELWTPLGLDPQAEGPQNGIHSLRVIARLRPGVTEQQAQQELEGIRSHFEKITRWGIHFSGEVRVISLHEKLVKNVRRLALLLWGAVGLILLIACANVTNLLLSRAAVREKELAVRAALGAGRLRLVRQMLAESSLLSCCGGACGLLIAYVLVRVLAAAAALPMFGEISRLVVIAVDSRSLCFTLLISVLTGLLISVVPALQLSRPDLQPYLNKSGRRGGCSSGRMRQVLMSAEVATAIVLLLAGGLLMRSFVKLLDVDPGFKVEGLLTARISLPYTRYPDRSRRAQFLHQVLQRVSSLPGVQSAGTTNRLPTTASLFADYLHVDGRPVTTEQQATPVPIGLVSPGYFTTMGIPLRAGRPFTESDDASAPRVVILSESLAQWLFPAENPIGKRVWVPGPGEGTPTVAGVVADVRSLGLTLFTWQHRMRQRA